MFEMPRLCRDSVASAREAAGVAEVLEIVEEIGAVVEDFAERKLSFPRELKAR